MSLWRRLCCCLKEQNSPETIADNPLDTPFVEDLKPRETLKTRESAVVEVRLEERPPQQQCLEVMLADEVRQYLPRDVVFELGFVRKPHGVEMGYLVKEIRYESLSESSLYYKVALQDIQHKLRLESSRVIFYCMCVPGMNSCVRSQGFIEAFRDSCLYFIFFTLETNLKGINKPHALRPILGGPESIRSPEDKKDWIILDYGQHGPCDNTIKQNSPSYSNIVPSITDAFYKSDNVVVIFPWGVTKTEIFDLHSGVMAELSNSPFDFDVELHSFRRTLDETELLIGFYGEGIRLRKKEIKEQYPLCILKLFDSIPNQQSRLFAAVDYMIDLYGHEKMLGMLCEMRHIDPSPESMMSSIFAKLRDIAVEKGVILLLEDKDTGEGSVSVFDLEADISHCNKKIVERSLSKKGTMEGEEGVEDYSFRGQFYKNQSRTFSRDFGDEISSASDDELNHSEGSV